MKESVKLTPTSDKSGAMVSICNPEWFDKRDLFQISNAPARTAAINFSGDDLNFVARVLYAESSGSMQLSDKNERHKEKQAILGVKHFRLNRVGYPNKVKAMTFKEVCEAPGQFESVYGSSPKFSKSSYGQVENMKKLECSDLGEAIDAIRIFLLNGPDPDLIFDNFRGGKGTRGETIGLSRFWLSDEGKRLYEKNS